VSAWLLLGLLSPTLAKAVDEYEAVGAAKRAAAPDDEPTSDGPISGPFSEYGEFDAAEDEANDEKFFQFGRFFGVGLGTGLTTATGNSGKLYQGGFPMIDGRLAYWFDFQVALQVALQNSKHNYNLPVSSGNSELVDTNLFRILFQVKYYFDTRDLSAPITFVGPHMIVGGGMYSRSDNKTAVDSQGTSGATSTEKVNAFGMNFGMGFELTIKPRKTYLQLEALAHLVQFSDQYDNRYAPTVNDKTGTWITAGIALMWTW